jgi:hypothetical protein
MFRRVYTIKGIKNAREEKFNDEESMKTSLLLPVSSKHPWGWITVNESKDDNLLRSYEYFNPAESKIINFNSEEDIVTYDNGLRINGRLFNLIQSMKMSVILGEEVPHSVVHRAISLFNPDHWYKDNEYTGILDKVSCDFQYAAKVGCDSVIDIFFGFIRVKEHPEDINLMWKFNSIFMYSTISGNKKIFGCNSFQDSSFERFSTYVGPDGIKKFMNTADEGDDASIADELELKPCNHESIFDLCNDSMKGIFI